MITAVDTNVLLDILVPGSAHADESEMALVKALSDGTLVISEPVLAELAGQFVDASELEGFLEATHVRLLTSSHESLLKAGQAWAGYARSRSSDLACSECGARQNVTCSRCGATIRPRQHVLPDFLIGAHASTHADLLLTRDRGYYRTYFPDLTLA